MPLRCMPSAARYTCLASALEKLPGLTRATTGCKPMACAPETFALRLGRLGCLTALHLQRACGALAACGAPEPVAASRGRAANAAPAGDSKWSVAAFNQGLASLRCQLTPRQTAETPAAPVALCAAGLHQGPHRASTRLWCCCVTSLAVTHHPSPSSGHNYWDGVSAELKKPIRTQLTQWPKRIQGVSGAASQTILTSGKDQDIM